MLETFAWTSPGLNSPKENDVELNVQVKYWKNYLQLFTKIQFMY